MAKRMTMIPSLLMLAALTTGAAGPTPATSGSLKLEAGLQHRKLPQQTEGETFLRVAVRGEKVASNDRMPMNVALVIDRSGSMGGAGPKGTNKMEDAKKAAKAFLDQLGAADQFAVFSFDNGAELLAAGEATLANLEAAKAKVDALRHRGGTDMVAGLRDGIAQVKAQYRQDRTNRVLLISDGVPNTTAGLVEMARTATRAGVQTTTIGVGTDYNEDLMSKIADAGAGNYHFIGDASTLAACLQKELKELMAVVGREAVLKVHFAAGVKAVKVYGYDAQLSDGQAIVQLGDLFGGQVAEVLVKVRHPRLEGEVRVARAELTWHDAVRKADRRASEDLVASFVGDAKAVAASLDKTVAAKAEKIAVADVVNQAAEHVRAGRRDEALKLVRAQNAQNVAAQSALGFSAKDTGGDALVELEGQLAAPAPAAPAASESILKAAKQKARDMSR